VRASAPSPEVGNNALRPNAVRGLLDPVRGLPYRRGTRCKDFSVSPCSRASWGRPHGRQIQLAVSRIQHTSSASDYQGAILTNPGGPGGSRLDLNTFLVPVLQSEGFNAAADDYDWIGFDPRGVGSSIPAISCDPNYFSPDRPNYVARTRKLLGTWLSRSQSYAQDCGSQSPLQSALLRNLTTRDSAMDMDSIRKALGLKQITYYGFSYGTYLGQVYSTMFPSHVRRLIMDSNIDPRAVWYQANLNQDPAFNRNENIWSAGWRSTTTSTTSVRPTVQHLFYATEHQLIKNPAGGEIGPDEWVDIFLEPA
jgi:pimeloyl-ACP methyl ester carboxylesterase